MTKKLPVFAMVQCPKCGVSVRKDRLKKHVAKTHLGSSSFPTQSSKKRNHKREIAKKAILKGGIGAGAAPSLPNAAEQKQEAKHEVDHYVYLESRRGVRIETLAACQDCRRKQAVLWKYARSSHGEIKLCFDCKAKAFDRSFGKIDALDMAFSGGAFESSRRKH